MASIARRLPENAAGDFFVDDSCIDCGACRWLAPTTFAEGDGVSYVRRQPEGATETRQALEAVVACPTSSIGDARKRDLRSVAGSFPRTIEPGSRVYYCGYHSEASFGAASWLIVRHGGNVLIDSPRFNRKLVSAIERLGGVDRMVLSHRDDVADHARFAAHFGCRRVLHARDVTASTRDVEDKPRGEDPIALADDLLFIPTPGHTAGSACLLYAGRYLFTGDHLAFDANGATLVAFDDVCWYDWSTQIRSMQRLLDYRFEWVLPGHGAPGHLPASAMTEHLATCIERMRNVA